MRVAGKLDINKEHNVLYDPEELRPADDILVFMEENQYVVVWGIRSADLSQSDPQVYQAATVEPLEWYPEELTFSQFIIAMWKWQRGLGEHNPVP